MEQKKHKYENVLIARFSALGDVAMCIPVLYDVCSKYRGTQFTFVTRKSYATMLINKPENLNVIGVDLEQYKGIAGISKLSSELGRPNVFIDLHSVLRSRLLGFFMRLKDVKVVTFDKGRKYKRKMVKSGAAEMSPLKPTSQRYEDALIAASLRYEHKFEGLFAEAAPDASIFADVTAAKQPGEQWIGIAPFAAHEGKIYPLDRMQTVLDGLAANENRKIFLFGGGENEIKTLTEWASKYKNVTCVAGKNLGFVGEMSLMYYLDVMLSMDSGNMHLAAISGTRTVSIWCATHPAAGFVAWRSKMSDRLGASLDCRPCSIFGNKPCKFGDLRCMLSIKPQAIIAHINKILS